MSISEDVYNACRISDRVYALNPYLQQQNFYSQQLRALALASEIADRHFRLGARNIYIVGAGIAGRTLAAAFHTLGAGVTLVEKSEEGFTPYLNSVHRELHPNIIFWPFQDPIPVTCLPFLNWAQNEAPEVVAQLKREWKAGFGDKVKLVSGEVIALKQDRNPLELVLKDKSPLHADICVLATGFAGERQVRHLAAETPGYWSPSAISDHQGELLVSGSGDGGLIDALSPLLGKDVTKAAHTLATRLRNKPILEDIKAVEKERAQRLLPGSRDSELECSFYATVQLEPEDAREVDALVQRRIPQQITFLYKTNSPYSFTAAPINKLLLSHFSNGGTRYIEQQKGELKDDNGKAEIVLSNGDRELLGGTRTRFRKVMVRHGAAPALESLLPESDVKVLKLAAAKFAYVSELTDYEQSKYPWKPSGVGASRIGLNAIRDSIYHAIAQLGRRYDLDLSRIKAGPGNLTSGSKVEINLPNSHRAKADALGIFPLKIGQAKIVLTARKPRRGISYAD